MSAAKICLACFWGAAAFCLLCYGLVHSSAGALLLFAALVPSLVAFLWWMIDGASLEHRIRRLEARSEIAAERRAVMQTNLTEVEHKLEEVNTKVASAERIKAQA